MNKYKKLLFSSLGSAFEYYDLAIYSVFAVAIGEKFFDKDNTISSTLMVFLVYVGGYLVRPFGAWTLGYIADKKGRAFILKLNMVLLFCSTLLLAILPSVESIGVWATLFFVSLRCIQAIAIGAEIPVAVIFTIENYPKRQGLVTGIIFSCLSLGIMMTTVVLFIVTNYTSDSFVKEYGWRIGFLIGAIFTFSLFFLRKGIVDDLPKPVVNLNNQNTSLISFVAKVLVGMMLVACIAMLTTQLYMFLPSFYQMYLTSKVELANLLLVGSIIMTISCIIGGFISDYVPKEKLMGILVLISIALAPIFYKNVLDGRSIYSCFIILSIVMGFFASTYNVIIVNYFNFDYRGRGLGLAYNLGYLVFSAGVPAFSIFLISTTESLLIPAYLIVFAGVISLIGLVVSDWFTKKV
ncbi:MFS transporter [Allofrancisella guangzhouensis]|uniref:MFS transporter n=1 Tax=Allofrancisella guangzhouensis TaxID=594679 RepID=A0A0A8E5D0_9GAMM|nr:MFS transporter [Allofrancisella guangzhouensis]AJC49203.1 MFS transporter [Allofrancisella guangzhouensis]MBK2027319.1 MFS transporter [Allofrancisella guangzhouensis]MBK2043723.1 MFS transporter [Allofrancisella guangzhouensis]MBK2045315.1 MFS transporter [Allofrancisella guangzhouensis]